MSVTYRDAGSGDAAALAGLGRVTFTETFGHLYSAANLAAFLENHSVGRWRRETSDPAFAIRIAEAEGRAVAYAALGPPSLPFEVTAPTIELRQFYVLQPWHGQGIAPELMRWVLCEARTRGAEELYLSVFTDNERARRFYARYGFETVGTYHFMVGDHADDDLIMRLKLKGRA